MKKLLFSLCVAIAFLPAGVYALTIQSSTISSSDTGGIVGSSEASVIGSSDASAEIHTIVTGGAGGGSVDIEIKTETDGVVHTESSKKKIPPSKVSSTSTPTRVWGAVGTRSFRGRVWEGILETLHSIFWFL